MGFSSSLMENSVPLKYRCSLSNTVRLRRLSVETERGKTRERGKRGEINEVEAEQGSLRTERPQRQVSLSSAFLRRSTFDLKSCLLPHEPHSLISLSFQADPNSIAILPSSPSTEKSPQKSVIFRSKFF